MYLPHYRMYAKEFPYSTASMFNGSDGSVPGNYTYSPSVNKNREDQFL